MSSDPKIVAHHEAGHAVVALVLGLRVLRVEIREERLLPLIPRFVGFTTVEAPDGHDLADQDQTLNRLVTCMAGDVAENIYTNGDPKLLMTASDDIDWAFHRVEEKLTGVDNPKPIVDAAIIMAQGLLGQPPIWRAVEGLAKELLQARDMNEGQVIEMVNNSSAKD